MKKSKMYENCKKLIDNGRYEYEDMVDKIGVFHLNSVITAEEFTELKTLMDSKLVVTE